MDIKNILEKLCLANGVAGSEGDAGKVAKTILCEYGEVTEDLMGNIICHVKGTGKKILLDAHIDEIGMIVTAIDENGFLKVAKSGGIDLRMLLGCEVTVHGKENLYGVFCCKPPHLISSAADYSKTPELDELAIDVGMNKEKASEMVSLGDRVSFRKGFNSLLGNFVTCKSLDDRAGMASIIYALELLKNKKLGCDLYVGFSVQEELGTRGVAPLTYNIKPDQAIAVDVSFAMTPDTPRHKCGDISKGPMVGFSPVLSKPITKALIEIAENNKIPYQKEIMAGETGTNADVISMIGAGVETALISIPLKYMHTPVEVVDLKDIENVSRLIATYVESLEENND